MRNIRTRTAFLSLFAALALAPAAHAAGWVSTGPLSPPGQFILHPQVLLAPNGDRVISWIQTQELIALSPAQHLAVRVGSPTGSFGPIQTFDGSPEQSTLTATADGTLALVWIDEADHKVHLARRQPGQGSFVQLPPLSVPGGGTPDELHVATDGSAVWVTFSSLQNRDSAIWAARLPHGGSALEVAPGAGAGGSVEQVTSSAQALDLHSPNIGANRGQIYVTWEEEEDGTSTTHGMSLVKFARTTSGGSTFGAPVPIDSVDSGGADSTEVSPHLAVGGGHVYELWLGVEGVVLFEDLTTGGPIRTIPDPANGLSSPLVGADGAGTLFVAGQDSPADDFNFSVGVALVPAGTTPQPPMDVTPFDFNRELESLAVASDGAAVVVFSNVPNTANGTVQVGAVFKSTGSGFGRVEDVSGLQDSALGFEEIPSAAVTPGGRAVVLWVATDHSGTASQRLHLSERDATPPRFTRIAVPALAAIGQRVQFAARASDTFSTPTTVWDFGDGSGAAGAQVSHVYGRPGRHRVTVSAVDSVGNQVRRMFTVKVGPAGSNDRTAPVIKRLSLTHGRFRVGSHATAEIDAARRAPRGTAFRVTVSERSTLAILIRRGRSLLGTLVRGGRGPGPVHLAFSGRIGQRALPPGHYTATVTAVDGAGNRSRSRSVKFTVVKR